MRASRSARRRRRSEEAAYRKVIRFNLDKKVHGVCPGGSTGEGHTFTVDEFKRVMEITAAEVAGQVPIVAGIISNSTRDAINRAKAIAHLPVAALQVTPVHYLFKPDEQATHNHFKALTEAVDTPVVIYNVVPWNYLNPAQMIRLMKELPGVQGINRATSSSWPTCCSAFPAAARCSPPSMPCCTRRSRSAPTAPSPPHPRPCPASA